MPLAILLCGPAGSGKSTYARKTFPNFPVLSTDDHINNQAHKLDKAYSEIFDQEYPIAEEKYFRDIEGIQKYSGDFVLDRTHLTEQSRKKILRRIDPKYTKMAVFFPAYTPDILHERINARAANGGHFVARQYTDKMHHDYKLPQETEGFDFVVSSSYLEKILKYFNWREHGFKLPSHC